MFRYGLIGGITVYGGAAAMFGYIGWEMLNIAKLSIPIEEDVLFIIKRIVSKRII